MTRFSKPKLVLCLALWGIQTCLGIHIPSAIFIHFFSFPTVPFMPPYFCTSSYNLTRSISTPPICGTWISSCPEFWWSFLMYSSCSVIGLHLTGIYSNVCYNSFFVCDRQLHTRTVTKEVIHMCRPAYKGDTKHVQVRLVFHFEIILIYHFISVQINQFRNLGTLRNLKTSHSRSVWSLTSLDVSKVVTTITGMINQEIKVTSKTFIYKKFLYS